ncbi:TlpA disulfide reductase family protein [Parasutterella excrementihominis]|uniref:TlpA family protein disulfide reductase n=1 Tax=Parasutterella excrementihominis TaxID=487175 RepID=UPI00242B6336|nr:TlpA disulfide reductase family protein [Parasutterella excrementihominis]
MKKLLVLSCLAGTVLFSSVPKAADFDRVYETGTPLKAPRMMPNFRELKHALKMPQFDLKTIYGTDVNLSDYKGKVIVLNVWATWCRPCVAEIPELITAQKALKNSDVRVIGVAVDGENVDLKKFLDNIRASGFETFIDSNQAIPGKMGVSVVPTNFIIDGNGNLVAYAEGYLPWENPQIISFLKEIGKKYASGPSAAKKPVSAPVGSVGSVFKISQF